jgi:hypothetical protein
MRGPQKKPPAATRLEQLAAQRFTVYSNLQFLGLACRAELFGKKEMLQFYVP